VNDAYTKRVSACVRLVDNLDGRTLKRVIRYSADAIQRRCIEARPRLLLCGEELTTRR